MTTHSRMPRHMARADGSMSRPAPGRYLPIPRVVQWMATLRCGLHCPHCLAFADGGEFADMPLELARTLIDQVAEMGVSEFLLTGGEPLARQDLPAVIDHLAVRQVSYSINTATLPGPEALSAMKRYPPAFVAVSLDGPRDVHDAFRGRGSFDDAMRATEIFAGLGGCAVTVGTTVTAFNYSRLPETMAIVAASPAQQWGVHLVVPEGRAASRPDLMLSRAQLRGLVRWVASGRKYFPLSMADEIGYCGDYEPLLRDEPLVCGAGRAQCVVLPDGSVVPCTTLDRSASAGNIHQRPLADIWRDGFAELRNWRPQGQCRRCGYAPACGGGCWLQRRHGRQCFKSVWHVPGVLKTAAGVAVCLGVLAIGNSAYAADPPPTGPTPAPPAATRPWANNESMVELETAPGIERLIMIQYAWSVTPGGAFTPTGGIAGVGHIMPPPTVEASKELKDDPAYAYFVSFTKGDWPKDIIGTSKAIDEALKTREKSLALASLFWRHVSQALLDGDPARRTADERKAVRQTLGKIQENAQQWRKDIYELRLDPYLARGRTGPLYRFMMTKGLPHIPAYLDLWHQTQFERWGRGDQKVVDAFLDRHPLAQEMEIAFQDAGEGVTPIDAQGKELPDRKTTIGIFDVLRISPEAKAPMLRVTFEGKAMEIKLPPGTELTYIDIVKLAYQQHSKALDDAAARDIARWMDADSKPLLLLPVMKIRERASTAPAPAQGNPALAAPSADLWLANFWLF